MILNIVSTHVFLSLITHADTVNNFVQVSFELSVLNLNFIDQPKEGEKSYLIMYGPVTQDCKDLPLKTTGHLSNVNSISLQLNYTESTSICFSLVTNNGTKSVIVEGIYVPGRYYTIACK